ncbi:MAG: glycine cleavage system aminomethyltransferase GcvT [Aquifex sp.]|nr:MAG: glycine cleavage system aminomethyltransferase GcvT [Aquifex sp.]
METPLKDIHKKLKTRFTDFAGWRMPLQYSSIVEEVKAVRSKAGIFDISHMGRILLEGKNVKEKLQFLTTNNIEKLSVGKVQYNLFTNEKGGVKDDITVYKLAEDKFFLCVNAANKEKIIKWLSEFVSPKDVSEDYLQIAIQGPESENILNKFFNVSDIRYYRFKTFGDTIISRTGYTGEDGFEVYIKPKEGIELFEELIRLAVPCGLGARDILRIEAGFPLYGNEISESITPFEANLDRFVDTNKDFLGKEEMLKKEVKKKLFGLELEDKGVPRKGYKIFKGDKEIGYISSGTFSPTLNKGIALCFVQLEERREGNEVEIAIRDKRVKGRLRKYPFVRRK